jgi:hypothetical protein
MQVDVEDGLPSVRVGIDHKTVSAFGNALLRSKLFGYDEKPPNQWFIFTGEQVDRVNVPVWDDQNMSRRGRAQITEGCHLFVTEDSCAGNFSRNNFAKNAVGHFGSLK